MDFESRLRDLEEELTTLREKVSFFSVIYDKFDKTLEKLEERQNLDKREMQDMMDKIRNDLMKGLDTIRLDMKNQHLVENNKIETSMSQLSQKVDDLNKWRWIVVGGAAIIGWLLSKLFSFDVK
jgi:DNA repair exonuclease SbcCD ATPase subunit